MLTENQKTKPTIIERTCHEFRRAGALIEALDDAVYRFADESSGSVGAQFRHNLEVAENFLRGLDEGLVDYGNRVRDPRVEVDRKFAILRFGKVVERLAAVVIEPREMTVLLVRSEVAQDVWHRSSVGRELESLLSHTIHHHAIVAHKLRGLGIDVSADFGLAPSTIQYRASVGQKI